MLPTASTIVGTLAVTAALAADPVQTNPENYKVLIENDHVRVLQHSDEPGAETLEHDHPPFVIIALAPFRREIVLPDGRTMIREFAAGDVLFSEAQTHVGRNIGDTPTRTIIVELKR